MTPRGIARAVAAGELVRLRTGRFIAAAAWAEARPEARHLVALAAAQCESSKRILSHRSAATLHGLPVWSRWLADEPGPDDERWLEEPLTVHTSGLALRGGTASPLHIRHRDALEPEDVVAVNGFACTTPERAVADVARSEPFPIALACADALLRTTLRNGRAVDHDGWQAWRRRTLERVEQRPGQPGNRALRAIAYLADPRADSPLESASRLRLLQCGIEFEVQKRVRGTDGRTYYPDFWLTVEEIFGECDGRVKYVDEEMRGGSGADDVWFDEKLRHDAIGGALGRRGIRWAARHVTTVERFAAHLRSLGVTVPGRASRTLGVELACFLDALP